jgi:hypothetical protein
MTPRTVMSFCFVCQSIPFRSFDHHDSWKVPGEIVLWVELEDRRRPRCWLKRQHTVARMRETSKSCPLCYVFIKAIEYSVKDTARGTSSRGATASSAEHNRVWINIPVHEAAACVIELWLGKDTPREYAAALGIRGLFGNYNHCSTTSFLAECLQAHLQRPCCHMLCWQTLVTLQYFNA